MSRRIMPIALGVCLVMGSIVISQDELPQGGQTPPTAPRRPAAAAATPAPNSPEFKQQVSYALGQNFAQNLRENDIECELDSLVAGIKDVLSGANPKYSEDQLRATMMRFSQDMQEKAMTRMNAQAGKNKREADAFFAQNAKREGVQTTPSGLQYRVLKEGDGASPTSEDVVKCNYRGTLLNGTEFDNSAQHGGPQTFRVGGVIPGWTEALQKMKVGDKWQLFVPPNLAYGMDPPGPPIEPNSALVFEIELIGITPK